MIKKLFQVLLGITLLYTGTLHLTSQRLEFQAQVPPWLGLDPDFVVIASGYVEIALGLSLITLWRFREDVGLATAIFFILIFPGNIRQYIDGIAKVELKIPEPLLAPIKWSPVPMFYANFIKTENKVQKIKPC